MIISQLKEHIEKCNKAYRDGRPIISDEQYDTLVSALKDQMDSDEFPLFMRTLTEEGGTVKHNFIIGSLDKVKYGEGTLAKWIPAGCKLLIGSAKVDGMSYTAVYKDGILSHGQTRGDGYFGKDITDKLKIILPQRLNAPVDLEVRGELTLMDDSHEIMGMENRRNGTVGIMKRLDATPEAVSHIKALAHQILDTTENRWEQYVRMQSLGFSIPAFKLFHIVDQTEEHLAEVLAEWKKTLPYDVDGIVLFEPGAMNENVYIPKNSIAFKVNQDAVPATVLDIEWNVSKAGLLKPVLLITPTKIDGSTIGRVTGNNAQWLKDQGIGINSSVGVIKSGDVIPKVIEVYSTAPFSAPTACKHCGAPTAMQGVDLTCTGENCSHQGTKEAESWLVKLGVENAKEASLKAWGVESYLDALAVYPDSTSKMKFLKELMSKVFNQPEDVLFAAMRFDGLGRSSVKKLLAFYGSKEDVLSAMDRLVNGGASIPMPEGFGEISMSKGMDSWARNMQLVAEVIKDPRWAPVETDRREAAGDKLAGKSFLFTGTIGMKRKDAEAMVTDNGGTLASSVSKNLSYLIAGASAGSKLEKAEKLGIPVITEEQFVAMVG